MNRLCLRSWPLAEEQLDWKVIGNQSLRSASASQIDLKPKSCLARGSLLARLFASSESRCGARKLRFQLRPFGATLKASQNPILLSVLSSFLATLVTLIFGKIQWSVA